MKIFLDQFNNRSPFIDFSNSSMINTFEKQLAEGLLPASNLSELGSEKPCSILYSVNH